MHKLLWLTPLVVACALRAEVPDGFSRVLVPLAAEGKPDANGTRLSTELSVYNATAKDILVGEDIFALPIECPPIPTHNLIPSHTDSGLCQQRTAPIPADLLYVRSDIAGEVLLNLRVREQSTGIAEHTEVPVVWDSMLFSGRLWLMGVPESGRTQFSTIIRIYEVSGKPRQVRVRLWRAGGSALPAAEALVTLQAEKTPPLQLYPSYAEVFLDARSFPNLPVAQGAFMVEITPVDGPMRFWAMATIMDNLTQTLNVILPQYGVTPPQPSLRLRHR